MAHRESLSQMHTAAFIRRISTNTGILKGRELSSRAACNHCGSACAILMDRKFDPSLAKPTSLY